MRLDQLVFTTNTNKSEIEKVISTSNLVILVEMLDLMQCQNYLLKLGPITFN